MNWRGGSTEKYARGCLEWSLSRVSAYLFLPINANDFDDWNVPSDLLRIQICWRVTNSSWLKCDEKTITSDLFGFNCSLLYPSSTLPFAFVSLSRWKMRVETNSRIEGEGGGVRGQMKTRAKKNSNVGWEDKFVKIRIKWILSRNRSVCKVRHLWNKKEKRKVRSTKRYGK